MTPLFTLVYASQSVDAPEESDLMEIYAISRMNNLKDGITGFLIYRDGYYLQLLEGPEDKVRTCFARIQKDIRHRSINILGEMQSTERLMADWSMGQVEFRAGHSTAEQILDLFELARNNQVYSSPAAFMTLVKLFSKNAIVY